MYLGDLNIKQQLAPMKTKNSIPFCCSAAFYIEEGRGEDRVLLTLCILRNFFSWIPKVSLLSFTVQGHIQWEKVWQNFLWFKPKIGVQFFSTVPHWLKLRALWKMASYGPMLFLTTQLAKLIELCFFVNVWSCEMITVQCVNVCLITSMNQLFLLTHEPHIKM